MIDLRQPRVPAGRPEPSLSALVTGIIHDAQELMKQEVALARQEIKQELVKTKDVALAFAAGAGVAALAAVFLLLMIAFLITWASADRIPLWASFGIVGIVLGLCGGILFYNGRNRAEEIHLIPRQTVETLRENAQWIKTQT
jgi:uncharacterized membrane protein YqjE